MTQKRLVLTRRPHPKQKPKQLRNKRLTLGPSLRQRSKGLAPLPRESLMRGCVISIPRINARMVTSVISITFQHVTITKLVIARKAMTVFITILVKPQPLQKCRPQQKKKQRLRKKGKREADHRHPQHLAILQLPCVPSFHSAALLEQKLTHSLLHITTTQPTTTDTKVGNLLSLRTAALHFLQSISPRS